MLLIFLMFYFLFSLYMSLLIVSFYSCFFMLSKVKEKYCFLFVLYLNGLFFFINLVFKIFIMFFCFLRYKVLFIVLFLLYVFCKMYVVVLWRDFWMLLCGMSLKVKLLNIFVMLKIGCNIKMDL